MSTHAEDRMNLKIKVFNEEGKPLIDIVGENLNYFDWEALYPSLGISEKVQEAKSELAKQRVALLVQRA